MKGLVLLLLFAGVFGLSAFSQVVLKTSGGKLLTTPGGKVLTKGACGSTTSATDIDGNVYGVVAIGNQCWLAQNLNATRYADGTALTYAATDGAWAAFSTTDFGYSYYNYSVANRNTYGLLYTWAAATRGSTSSANPSGVQGICPNGWHIPSLAEWSALETTLGGASVAGAAMKESGTTHWSNSTGATNSSGFTGLPGGDRSDSSGASSALGQYGNFWSSEQSTSTHAYYRYLSYTNNSLNLGNFPRKVGFSVRCLKN